MKLEGFDDQLMAMAAHRYCLGRQSYIVGTCLDWLRVTWPQMERNTQHVILRDTIEALLDNRAGHDIDVRGWTKMAQWIWTQMDERQHQAMLHALEHRNMNERVIELLTAKDNQDEA